MSANDRPGIPNVAPRPSVIEAMRRLAAPENSVEETYQAIWAVAMEYLPPGASLRHGEIIGWMLVWVIFPPELPPGSSIRVPQIDKRQRMREAMKMLANAWDDAYKQSPSPLAADRAVRAFNAELITSCWEPWVGQCCRRLQEEKIRHVFPEEAIIY